MKNLIFVTIFMITLAQLSEAEIPRTLSYQGVLTDSATGEGRSGEFSFTFRFYVSASGGTEIWEETKTVAVTNGLFSTLLGSTEPFGATVRFDKQYWLGIQVENEPELSPRIPLTSVGYSMSSLRADTALVSLASVASGDTTWLKNGADIYRFDGNVGIGMTRPADKLHVAGSIRLSGNHAGSNRVIFADEGSVGKEWELYPTANYFMLYNRTDRQAPFAILNNGNVGIGTTNPTSKLHVQGTTTTKVLAITGGADIAEPFEITENELLSPGTVVCIDPDNPGRLRQATVPYDTRVAGVISGAGGVNPGLTLTQHGLLEGGQQVALTGKVYALATAINGPIQPGDLLTTSEIPGHAMKATDRDSAFGAVIGKAMSRLEQGEGLVFVLVNLQ